MQLNRHDGTKKVTLIIAGSAAGGVRAVEEMSAAAEASSAKMTSTFDKASDHVGGTFTKLGTTLSNWGIPFAGSITAMGRQMDEAESKGKKFAAQMSALGKVSLGAGLVGVAAVGIESVKSATKFQSSMEMLHTQAQVPQDQIAKLESGVLSLAGSVATSPDSLSEALYHIESTLPATMSSTQKYTLAMSELKMAAEGAKVGHSDLTDTTNALNAVVSSGIPGVQNLSQAQGALNAIVGAGDMKMQDLSDAMGSGMVAVVKGYGLSLNDVGAALATFGDNNIRGADAATMVRTAVQALAVPAKGGAAALTAIGISQTQLAKDMQTGGLNKAMIDLHDHLVAAGDTGAKTGLVLTEAFGKKAGTGLQVLQEQFDRFESKETAVAAGATSFSSDWAATTQTLSFQMDSAKATVEALGDKLGMWLIPKLQQLAVETSKAITWLQKHKQVTKDLAIAIGGVLVSAIAAYIMHLTIAAVKTVAEFAKMIASGVSWVAKQAANFAKAIADGAVWLAEHVAMGVSYIATNVAMAASATAAFIAENAATLGIAAGVALVIAGIVLLATHWKEVWGDIKQWAGDAWHWLDDNVVHPIVSFFVTQWKQMLDQAKQAWDDVWGFFKNVAHDAYQWVWTDTLKPIVDFYETLLGDAVKIGEAAWSDFWKGIHDTVSVVWSYLKPIFDQIKQYLSDITGGLKGVVGVASKVGGAIGHVGGGLLKSVGIGAEGAIVTGPTLAMIGEAGAEAVMPLNRMPGARPLPGGTGGGSGATVNINIDARYGTPGVAQQIKQALDQHTADLMRGLGMAS